MSEWTIADVAMRFSEAADTGRRLPRVRVQGHFNVWPVFAREAWEGFTKSAQDAPPLAVGRNECSWGGLDAHPKICS